MTQKTNEQKGDNLQLKLSIINGPTRVTPEIEEKKNGSGGYVTYGADNKFPQYLWNTYLKSPILQSIINGTADFMSGAGITFDTNNPNVQRLLLKANRNGETLEDIIEKCKMDFLIFGGFALNVIRDRRGDISELYWFDMQDVRLTDEKMCDEDPDQKALWSKKWSQYSSKSVEYPIFNPNERQDSSVFYFKGSISRGVYPVPQYIGAMTDVETSTEIAKYRLNLVLNNFEPSAIISFNNGAPSEQEKKEIEKKINEKFGGANNSGKVVVTFNDSKENAVTIERLSDDQLDKKYELMSKTSKENVFMALRALPALFGFDPDKTGFNQVEYEAAFKLYDKTVVKKRQNEFKKAFFKVLGMNSFEFNEYKIDWDNDSAGAKPLEDNDSAGAKPLVDNADPVASTIGDESTDK